MICCFTTHSRQTTHFVNTNKPNSIDNFQLEFSRFILFKIFFTRNEIYPEKSAIMLSQRTICKDFPMPHLYGMLLNNSCELLFGHPEFFDPDIVLLVLGHL